MIQGRALEQSARVVSQERSQVGTKEFVAHYGKFRSDLHSFASTAGNPLLEPVFLIVGSPSTYSRISSITKSASAIAERLAPALAERELQSAPTSGFNFNLLAKVSPAIVKSKGDIHVLLMNLRDLHLHGLLTPFDSTLNSIRSKSRSSLVVSDKVIPLLPVAPALLGNNGPRRYFVAFQNPAEARGTGGIIGAFAVIQADQGQITVESVGSNTQLHSLPQLPISMPSDFLTLYGQDPAIWQNSNMSPHFPNAAKIWMALWQKQTGQSLDGVITLDPFVLQAYLAATGPLKVLDQRFTAENLISETLSREYISYAKNNDARKQFLVELLKAALTRISTHAPNASQLLSISESSLSDNRIFLYSAHSEEEAAISDSSISGILPASADNSYRLVINNLSGNKMEYYLDRSLELTALKCGQNPETRVDLTLRNSVDPNASLPPYVNGRLDLGKPNGDRNTTKVEAYLYGPYGSTIIDAINSDTGEVPGEQATENGHPVLLMTLELKPMTPIHITAEFRGGKGPITHVIQPLVKQEKILIKDKCVK